MFLHLLIFGIILLVILAALDSLAADGQLHQAQTQLSLGSLSVATTAEPTFAVDERVQTRAEKPMPETEDITQPQPFTIQFPDGHQAQAMHVPQKGDAAAVCDALKLETPRPAIFISGGASNMSEQDIARTQAIMEHGIAKFAQEFGVTVIDGGTEAGVMAMIGAARHKHRYQFPLIGVAPNEKIAYPGKPNDAKDADLDDGHSHFVLVDADEWGEESQMIVDLTRTVSNYGERPACGILINGGKIAEHDVYIATAKGKHRIPMLILEGSGRAADDIATAFRTGKTNRAIIQAIIAGGAIKLVALVEGPDAMYQQLKAHFGV